MIINEYNLGCVSQIPAGEGRVFTIAGKQIAVFNTRSGAVYAVQAECPHRQGPLADGLTGGTTVLCPLHSRKFDLATGLEISGECALETYAARLSETGEILLALN